jgi:large subunit ribosomal protein L10e
MFSSCYIARISLGADHQIDAIVIFFKKFAMISADHRKLYKSLNNPHFMARLRKFRAYRRLERPNTRISKYKKMSYVKANPKHIVVRFDMGNQVKKFPLVLELKSKVDLQIRHNAIESARQSCNKLLETKIGPNDYALKVMVYPHHILRENPLAAGAGADRFSTGMAHSFGKPMSVAARVTKSHPIFRLSLNKEKLQVGMAALTRARYKLPCDCIIDVKEIKA